MAKMKIVLVSQLEDTNRSVDEHERTLESVQFHSPQMFRANGADFLYRILMDFQSNDEPLWTYLESQNKHIINRMTSEHENAVKKIEGMSEGILLPTVISRYTHSGSAQYPCIGFAWTTRTTDCSFTTAGKAAR